MIQRTAEFVYKYLLFFLPRGEPHPWDYVAHLIVSFAITTAIFLVGNKVVGINFRASLIAAIFAALAIGAVKEFADWRIGNTDIVADMIANILGVAAAVCIMFFVSKLLT